MANPNLRSEEAHQNAQRAALGGGTSSPFSNSFTQWFSALSNGQKGFMVGVGFFVVIFFGGFLSALRTDNKQSNSNDHTATNNNANRSTGNTTETKIVYPAGMSPSENLEKGRTALNEGDIRKAWEHLFHIPQTAKEYALAKPLLARIPERQQIEFELANLNEREKNLESMATGLAYKVEPAELKKRLDNIEKQQRQIFARRRELNRRLEKMP